MRRKAACGLCVAVEQSEAQGSRELWNTPLIANDRFVVLPALGALVPGHALITDRVHSVGLATTDNEAQGALRDLLGQLASRPAYREGLILAEHGSGEAESPAQGCIAHTHVHVLPATHDFASSFRVRLPPTRRMALAELWDLEPPYFFFSADGEEIEIAELDAPLPRQFVRRVLAEVLRIQDWDWAVFHRLDDVRATIDQVGGEGV